MTTTACDDQFAPEPVAPVRERYERYDTATILRRNIADLEIALKRQTDRAKAAEAELLAVREDNHAMMLEIDGMRTELAKLREQDPVAYVKYKATGGNVGLSWVAIPTGAFYPREGEQLYAAPVPAVAAPKLQVWFGSLPETNGKTNWTAILHRDNFYEGITIARSEYKDRVRYEADRMRWMIGELSEEPDILQYAENMHSGYTEPAVAAPSVPTDEQIHAVYRNALGQSIRERDMPEIRKFAIALLQSADHSSEVKS